MLILYVGLLAYMLVTILQKICIGYMSIIFSSLHLNVHKVFLKASSTLAVAGSHIYQACRSGWGGLCWLAVQNHGSESAKHSHSHLWMNSSPATHTVHRTLCAVLFSLLFFSLLVKPGLPSHLPLFLLTYFIVAVGLSAGTGLCEVVFVIGTLSI